MIIKIVLVKYHPQPPRAHHGAQEWHARTTRKAHRTCQDESQEMGGGGGREDSRMGAPGPPLSIK